MMFIDLLNSEWYDGQGNLDDRLLKPGWLVEFARRWQALGPSRSPRPAHLEPHPYFAPARGPLEEKPSVTPPFSEELIEQLVDLRALLRQVVEDVVADVELRPSHVRQLNEFLERSDVRHHLFKAPDGVHLKATMLVDEDEWLLGAVALSAAKLLSSGGLRRLKICDNDGCRWVFYDHTKNLSQRWCDTRLCGNLFKVRRYRHRHQQKSR